MVRLGDFVFAALRRIGSVTGPGCETSAARHIAIEAENYLALELLVGISAGQVDCIYIDPPYNSGATDWKYNNRFVDSSDRYRHSKWLSMMQRRLKLAARLLKPDGVLIVTIDENEVHRLGVLLQQLFPAATHQMVTVVIIPAGNTRDTFSRVEEHALFVFAGEDPSVCEMPDDLLTGDASRGNAPVQPSKERWHSLLRSGSNSRPRDRAGLVYPVWVDPRTTRIVATGRALSQRVEDGETRGDPTSLDAFSPPVEEPPYPGAVALWPRKRNGALATWGIGPSTLMDLVNQGYAKVSWNAEANTGTVHRLTSGQIDEIKAGALEVVDRDETGAVLLSPRVPPRKPMTVWRRSRHDSSLHGTTLLHQFLGDKRFDFPKSLYSTLDALAAVVKDRPDALVVDFFAGSGTTLHAVAALNAADGGRRRCVVVSNNEVSAAEAKALRRPGVGPGDAEWEDLGIFRHVLMPRTTAAVTGHRPGGQPVEGTYLPPLYERPFSDGLAAGIEFFELVCADPQRLAAGDAFDDVHPLLWAASGGHGPCPTELPRQRCQPASRDRPVLRADGHGRAAGA